MKNMRDSFSLSQISFYLFCSFPAFISIALKVPLAIILVVVQVLLIIRDKPSPLPNTSWLPFVLSAPFIFYIISLSYSSNLIYGYKYVESCLLLVILPWVLYFNRSYITVETLRRTLRYFTLVLSILMIYVVTRMQWSGVFEEATIAENSYFIIRTQLEEFSGMHPTYLSLMLALAGFTIQHELKNKTLISGKTVYAFSALLILSLGLLLAASKTILVTVFIGSFILWSQGNSLRANALRLMLVLSILIGTIVLFKPLQSRVSTMVEAFSNNEIDLKNPDSLRRGTFQSSLAVIAENFWMGTGIGDAQDALKEQYVKSGNESLIKAGLNSHNQYLHVWLSVGFIPVLIFITSILAQLMIALRCKNYLHLAFIMMVAIGFMTENILARQDGIFFYSFFSSMFCFASWSKFHGSVFVNGRYLSQPLTGVQRFAIEVSKHLRKSGLEFTTLTMNQAVVKGEERLGFLIFNPQLWEQVVLCLYLRLAGSPLLINFCNAAPIFYSNQIITIHDVAFKAHPSWFSGSFTTWYNFMIPRIIKNSKHLITVSEFSKSELDKYYDLKSDNISVVYNGLSSTLGANTTSSPIVEGRYALCVGSISERKNQRSLIDAYLALDAPKFKLVVAGSLNSTILSTDAELINQMNSSEFITFIECPSDAELVNLYTHSLFTIYIPHYEGFGLPVLESLAYEKPAILSDIPVFRELFSDIAAFVDLDDAHALGDQLLKMNDSLEYWDEKVSNYNFEAHRFTYEQSANKCVSIIAEYNTGRVDL